MAISYRKRGKKNLWDYRIFDKDKKVIVSNSGFRTKKEAELEAKALELKLIKGLIIDNKVTLYELWEKWYLLTVIPLNKAPSTLKKHELRGKRILDFFGTMPAVKIPSSLYQEFLNQYGKQVTRNTVSRLNAEIRNVISFAKRDRLEINDFTIGVLVTGQSIGKERSEMYISSQKDYQALISHLHTILDYQKSVIPYFIIIQLKTGMRFGEVLGLTWDCINWNNFIIRTYRRYDSISYEWKPPKTNTSIRNIPVDVETIKILKELKISQNLIMSYYGIENKEEFLFINPFYGVPTNNAVNKYLRKTLTELSIEPYNLSSTGIRHTYASLLLSYGIDIWVVAENMGHKDISQITQTYGHLIKEKAEIENNRIRDFLCSSKKF